MENRTLGDSLEISAIGLGGMGISSGCSTVEWATATTSVVPSAT